MRCWLVMLGCLMAAPAWGQEVRADGVAHQYADVYDDAEPKVKMLRRVDTIMGIYQTLPPRRHASERVKVKDRTVTVAVWQPVGRWTDLELKLKAVKWFVFGRNQFTSGVRGVFSEFPDVNEVRFTFHEVIRPDRKGRRRSAKPDAIKRYLGLRLARKRFNRLRLTTISGCVERADCNRVFRSAFNDARFNRKYTAKRRAED
jgi:hypothetical protein